MLRFCWQTFSDNRDMQHHIALVWRSFTRARARRKSKSCRRRGGERKFLMAVKCWNGACDNSMITCRTAERVLSWRWLDCSGAKRKDSDLWWWVMYWNVLRHLFHNVGDRVMHEICRCWYPGLCRESASKQWLGEVDLPCYKAPKFVRFV